MYECINWFNWHPIFGAPKTENSWEIEIETMLNYTDKWQVNLNFGFDSKYVTYFQFQFSNWNRIPAKICDFSYPSCMKTQNKLSAWKIGKNFFNRNRKFYIQDKNLFLKILQLNDWYMLWRQSLLVLAEKYFDILNSRDMIWRLRLNFLLVVFNLIWKRSSFRAFAQITLIWHECLMRISTKLWNSKIAN